jgi:hypothetical protein
MEWKLRGAWAELVACGWLLKEGYEVYRNVSDRGLCDVLATRNGEYFKFDVKIIKETVVAKLSRAQTESGVLLLGVYHDGRCVIDPARPEYGSGICKECGTFFKKTQAKHIFCQKSCGIKSVNRVQRELRHSRLTTQGKSEYQNTSPQIAADRQRQLTRRVNRINTLVFRGVVP